jgi:hypothetical protein
VGVEDDRIVSHAWDAAGGGVSETGRTSVISRGPTVRTRHEPPLILNLEGQPQRRL